jgi:hypothetical protein
MRNGSENAYCKRWILGSGDRSATVQSDLRSNPIRALLGLITIWASKPDGQESESLETTQVCFKVPRMIRGL